MLLSELWTRTGTKDALLVRNVERTSGKVAASTGKGITRTAPTALRRRTVASLNLWRTHPPEVTNNQPRCRAPRTQRVAPSFVATAAHLQQESFAPNVVPLSCKASLVASMVFIGILYLLYFVPVEEAGRLPGSRTRQGRCYLPRER